MADIRIIPAAGAINVTGSADFRGDSASTVLFVSGSGNVGVGTSNPISRLHVAGAVKATATTGHVLGTSTDTGRALSILNSGLAHGESYSVALGYANSSNNQAELTYYLAATGSTSNRLSLGLYNSSDTLNVVGTGRVGIGTTGPSTALEVIGAIRNKNAGGNTNYGQVSTTEALLNLSTYSVNTGAYPADITFSPNSTEAVRILSDGNVGIGTTAPTKPLHVVGGVRFSSYGSGTFTGTAARTLAVDSSGNVIEITNTSLGGSGTANRVAYWTDANTLAADADFFFDGTNVGIGNTAPAVKLQVIGNIGVGAGTYNGGVYANSSTTAVDNNWGFDFLKTPGQEDYSTRLKYYPATGDSRKGGIWNSRNNAWVIYGDSNNTPNVIIPSGSVGIGTTSPAEKLAVVGNIRAGGNVVASVGLGDGNYISMRHDDTNGYITITRVINAGHLILEPYANVGIGSTAPGYKLDVNGIVYSNNQVKVITSSGGVSGYFTDAVNSTLQIKHASGQLQFLNGSNIAWLKEDGSGAVTLSSDLTVNGKITAREFHTTFVSASIIYQSGSTQFGNSSDDTHIFTGNVGIGSTAPGFKLDVVGDAKISSNLSINGYSVTDGIIYHANNINILNKASSGWLTWATRNTSGTEVVVDLNYLGSVTANSFTGSLQGNITGTAASETLATVTGRGASTSTASTFSGGLTTNLLSFTAPTGDPSPLITSRVVPAGQGAANEVTELILFHSNDPNNGAGPDYITLRSPAIRLQTYNNAAVDDIDDDLGSNDRLRIEADGTIKLSSLTSNGFVKTSAGDGTLSIDTNTYLTAEADTLSSVTGRGASTSTASSFNNTLTVAGGGNTLTLVKGTGGSAIAFAGTSDEATGLIEGVSGGGLKFYSRTGSLASPTSFDSFNIKNGGDAFFNYNVGIGVTNPAQKLDVNGNAIVRSGLVVKYSSNSGEIDTAYAPLLVNGPSANSTTFDEENTTATLVLRGNADNVNLQLGTGGASIGPYGGWIQASYDNGGTSYGFEPLVLNPAGGDIGIGTTSPVSRLHISTGTPTGLGTLPSNTLLTLDNGNNNNFITIRNQADTGAYGGILFQDNNVGGYIAFRTYDGSGANDGTNGDYTVYGTYTDHIFQAGSSEAVDGKTEIMRIKSTGNVGINTSTPSNTLQVVGGVTATSFTGSLQGNITGTAGSETLATVTGRGSVTSTAMRVEAAATGLGGYMSVGNSTEVAGNYSAYFFGNTASDANYFKGGIAYETIASTYGRGNIHFLQNSTTSGDIVTLSDSVMTILNDGKVGIGNTSPTTAKLVVTSAGAAFSSTATKGGNMNGIAVVATTNENTMTGIWFASGTDQNGTHWSGIAGSRSDYLNNWATHLAFYTHVNTTSNINDTTEKMRITGEGSVGIGTTSPASLLDVAGTWKLGDVSGGSFKSYTYGTQLDISGLTSGGWARAHKISTSDSGGHVFFGVLGDNTTLTRAYWTIGDPATIDTTGYASSNGIILLKNGNVGIGNTSPSGKLHVTAVGGDGSAILRITGTASDSFNWASSTIYANLTAGETVIHQIGKAESQYNSGHYGYRHVSDNSSSNMMTIGMFQADYLVNILGNGNVGIGVTNPTQALHVAANVTTNTGVTVQNLNGSYSSQYRFLNSSGTEVAAITYIGGTTSSVYHYTSAAGNLLNLVGANVGIGTTSPGAKLDVVGDIFLSETGRLQGRAYPYDTTVGSGADAATATIEAGSTAGYRSRIALAGGNATDPNTIKMLTTSAERVRITSAGRVGINTTNPSGLLGLGTQATVQSTSGITLGVNDSSLEFVHATFSNGFGSKLYSADSGGGVTSLRIAGRGNSTSWSDLVTVLVTDNATTRGNVGIATTSPGEKLDVVGNIALSGIFKGTGTGENKNFASYDWHWLGRRYDTYLSDVRLKLYEYFYSTTATVAEAFVNCYDMNSVNYMGENIWGDVHNYHSIFTTHIYVKRQFTVSSVVLNGDDPYALWIDGAYVTGADSCCTGVTYSYTFTQGWHRLDLIYSELAGGHFVSLGWNPKDYTDYIAAMTPFGPVNLFDTGDVTMRNDRVGIGTTAPEQKLHVEGTIQLGNQENLAWAYDNGSYYNYITNFYDTSTGMAFRAGSWTGGNNVDFSFQTYYGGSWSTKLAIKGDGNVGVGTTAPAYKLDVTGTIRATGDVIAYSDRRVKENIVTLENSLDLVTKLRGVEYNKIGEEDKKIGVIAQEVLEVLPQVVQQDQDGNYSVAYGNMAGLFIEAIKQQQTRIETLEDRITVLEQLLRQKL